MATKKTIEAPARIDGADGSITSAGAASAWIDGRGEWVATTQEVA